MSFKIKFRGLDLETNKWIYGDLYHGLNDLLYINCIVKIDEKSKFVKIRLFIIEWLQEGKNHNELIHEITNYICNMPLNIVNRYLVDAANRSTYTESSKKIIYHLENLLCTFIN